MEPTQTSALNETEVNALLEEISFQEQRAADAEVRAKIYKKHLRQALVIGKQAVLEIVSALKGIQSIPVSDDAVSRQSPLSVHSRVDKVTVPLRRPSA